MSRYMPLFEEEFATWWTCSLNHSLSLFVSAAVTSLLCRESI